MIKCPFCGKELGYVEVTVRLRKTDKWSAYRYKEKNQFLLNELESEKINITDYVVKCPYCGRILNTYAEVKGFDIFYSD